VTVPFARVAKRGDNGTFCAGTDLKVTEGGRSARGRSRIADRRGEFAWSVEHDKCGAVGNFVHIRARSGSDKQASSRPIISAWQRRATCIMAGEHGQEHDGTPKISGGAVGQADPNDKE
jgi:hypothetical protein